jgi:hypothetical protein
VPPRASLGGPGEGAFGLFGDPASADGPPALPPRAGADGGVPEWISDASQLRLTVRVQQSELNIIFATRPQATARLVYFA